MSCNCNTPTGTNKKSIYRAASSRFRQLLGIDRNGCEVSMTPDEDGVMTSEGGKISFNDGSEDKPIHLDPKTAQALIKILGLNDSGMLTSMDFPVDGIEYQLVIKDGEATLATKSSVENVFTSVASSPVGKFAMFLQGTEGWSLRYLAPPVDDVCCEGKYIIAFNCDGTFSYEKHRTLAEHICGTTTQGQILVHDGECKLKVLQIPSTDCDPSLERIYAREIEKEYEITKECADGSEITQTAIVKEYTLVKSPYNFLPKESAVTIGGFDPTKGYKIVLYRNDDPDDETGCLQDVQLDLKYNGEEETGSVVLAADEEGVLSFQDLSEFSKESERCIYFNTPLELAVSGSGSINCSGLAGSHTRPSWANTAILRCTIRSSSDWGGININGKVAVFGSASSAPINSVIHNALLDSGGSFTYAFQNPSNATISIDSVNVNTSHIYLMGYKKSEWI